MRRRDLVAALLGAIAGGALAREQGAVARLAVLLFSTPTADPNVPALLKRLRELGYEEGRNLVIDFRSAGGRFELLPGLASELAALRPSVVVALGGDVAAVARQALATVPIAMVSSADPVRAGLVAGLAHPGGNVTGVTLLADELAGKRVELLAEILPRARRIAVLLNPEHEDDELGETLRAAASLGLEIVPLALRRLADVERVLAAAREAEPDAFIVVSSRLTNAASSDILGFAAELRVPVIAGWGRWAKLGALLAYGPSLDESVRRLASLVDRILRGARPAEIPVEQPERFELVLNLTTAQRLGIAVPQALLARADEVIE